MAAKRRHHCQSTYIALLVHSDQPPHGPSRNYLQRRLARQRQLLLLYNSVAPVRGSRPVANRHAPAELVLTQDPFAAADQRGRTLVACIGPFAQSIKAQRLLRTLERVDAAAENRLVIGCHLAASSGTRVCADLGLVYGDPGGGGGGGDSAADDA